MKHIIASGCNWTSPCPSNPGHVSNLKYATEGWSGGGVIILVVIIVVIVLLLRRRGPGGD